MKLLIEVKPITSHNHDGKGNCKRQWILYLLKWDELGYIWSRGYPLTMWYKYRLCRWCNTRLDKYPSLKKFLNFCEKIVSQKIVFNLGEKL